MYLRKKKNKRGQSLKQHIWDDKGQDTMCKLAQSGNIKLSVMELTDDEPNDEEDICLHCLRASGRYVYDPSILFKK